MKTSGPRLRRGTRADRPSGSVSLGSRLRIKQLSGLYVWIAIIGVFSLAVPTIFPTPLTVETILGDNAIAGLLALGALLAFAAGLIDLSFASIAGLALTSAVWMSIHTDLPSPLIVLIVVVGGGVIGAISGALVTRLGMSSLVTTLAVSTVTLGLAELVTGGNTLTAKWSSQFQAFGQGFIGVVPLPFIYLIVFAAVLYFVLEHTTTGRRVLATGSNIAAARLAGIRVARIQLLTLCLSGAVAGFAGAVLAAKIGSATTATGPGFLLASVAALFLGETQILGRVNVWGTVLATLLIGTGVKGLQLLGAQPWVNDFFNGMLLLLAVALAARTRITVGPKARSDLEPESPTPKEYNT
jgi:ribose transport system permease protein